MTKAELKERANKAAKRFADLFRTPKREAHWKKLHETNLGAKRSEASRARMRQSQQKRRAKKT
jgi:hypothetical protein